jgi:hypothetical protein
MAVLSFGTASEVGKAAAYAELNKLVQMLARRATWEQLRQNAVTRVVEQIFTRLGFQITQRKLGQAVPVVGSILGAGMNAAMLAGVVDDADHLYRERFLRERYQLEPVGLEWADAADSVDIAEILERELLDSPEDPDELDGEEAGGDS